MKFQFLILLMHQTLILVAALIMYDTIFFSNFKKKVNQLAANNL